MTDALCQASWTIFINNGLMKFVMLSEIKDLLMANFYFIELFVDRLCRSKLNYSVPAQLGLLSFLSILVSFK